MRSSFDERGRSLDDSLTHSARLSIVTSIQKRSVESALMATKKIRFSIRENKCAVQIPQEFQLGGGKIKIQPCGNTPLFRHKKTLMGATHGQSKEVLGRLHAPGSATTRLPNAEASFRIKLRIVSPGSLCTRSGIIRPKYRRYLWATPRNARTEGGADRIDGSLNRRSRAQPRGASCDEQYERISARPRATH